MQRRGDSTTTSEKRVGHCGSMTHTLGRWSVGGVCKTPDKWISNDSHVTREGHPPRVMTHMTHISTGTRPATTTEETHR